jgi:hypothetical protein
LEKGKPLSFAKTQMRRDTEAKILNRQKKKMTRMSEIIAFVAVLEPVAP